MLSFALITEGITDQVVLEHLLEEFYDVSAELDIYVNHIQPLRDATDESRTDSKSFGGWEKVLEYCSISKTITDSIAHNDYVVIQIDTDCGDHPNFGVPLTREGADRAAEEIISDTKELIIEKIGEDLYSSNEHRFIFAIAVHSLECWILSFHATGGKDQTKSCEDRLKKLLAKNDLKFSKDFNFYRELTRPIKGKDLLRISGDQTSLGRFLSSLPQASV